ncbi:MAG TPA: MFS transporter [Spirochaetia bacterium]|nr:MFS transporter [Spirochaetia bacterium]
MLKGAAGRYSLAYLALFAIYGIVSPYLPVLLRGLGYGPAALGLLLALFEVAGIIGPLVLTAGADARSRGGGSGSRPLLAGTALCVLASLPGLALPLGPAATALSLVLLALGLKTMVPLMDALVSSYAASRGPALRGGYGRIRAPGTLGFIAAALALQAAPAAFSGSPPALAACMGLATLAFLAAALALPAPPASAGPSPAGRAPKRRADPAFALGIAIIALNRMSMAPINSFLALYAKEDLGLDAAGAIWAISASAEIPFMLAAGRFIARRGPMPTIALSSVAIVARLALYTIFPSFGGIAAAQLLHSLCYGLYLPAAIRFVAERFPPERQATGMAIYMGAGVGLPAVLGSAIGGYVVEAWGYTTLFLSFTLFALASLALWAGTRARFERSAA